MMMRDRGGWFFVFNPLIMVLLMLYFVHDFVYGTAATEKPDKTVGASVRENPASYRPVVVLPAASVPRSTPGNPGAVSSSSGSNPSGGSGGGWNGGK
jgi:hypothetical protein